MYPSYQGYQQNNEPQAQTITPNAKKILLVNAIKMGFLIIVFFVSYFVLKQYLSAENFSTLFEFLPITIDIASITRTIMLIFLAAIVLLLLGTFFVAKKLCYVFENDGMTITQPLALLFTKTTNIPYQNIVKISFSNNGFFNSICNVGTITIELSAMKENSIELEYIDNVDQTARNIQNLIIQYKQLQQAQFTQQYRMDNIFSKYGQS